MQKMKSQQQTLLTESVDKNKVEYHIGIEPKETHLGINNHNWNTVNFLRVQCM